MYDCVFNVCRTRGQTPIVPGGRVIAAHGRAGAGADLKVIGQADVAVRVALVHRLATRTISCTHRSENKFVGE